MRHQYICQQCGSSFQREFRGRRNPFCSKTCSGANRRNRPLADRFWPKVKTGAPDECWEWQGARHATGYGRIEINGKLHMANRVAFFLANNAWPKLACHTCNNPPCCNPAHLYDGTYADNAHDAMRTGRHVHGVTHGMAKLDEEKVSAIRRLHDSGSWTVSMLAQEFSVSKSNIRFIIEKKTWRHVT